MGLADCLSRFPIENMENEQPIDDELMVLTVECHTSVSHDKICRATSEDDKMTILKQVIAKGWPAERSDVPFVVLQYWEFRDELATYNGVVYRGERAWIPKILRKETLKVIHSSHAGNQRSTSRSRPHRVRTLSKQTTAMLK